MALCLFYRSTRSAYYACRVRGEVGRMDRASIPSLASAVEYCNRRVERGDHSS